MRTPPDGIHGLPGRDLLVELSQAIGDLGDNWVDSRMVVANGPAWLTAQARLILLVAEVGERLGLLDGIASTSGGTSREVFWWPLP